MHGVARLYLGLGALSCLVATGLGAWASHALPARVDAATLGTVEIAIQYQFFTSLGLVAVALLLDRHTASRLLVVAGALLALGLLLFSGALYASALAGLDAAGSLAPLGGVSIMAGWAALAGAAATLRGPR